MELRLLLSGFLRVASRLRRPDLCGPQVAVIERPASAGRGSAARNVLRAGGQLWHPGPPLSPPGLRQDGGTARLLPGRPRAPGRAGPRALLTGSAEVAVAGLQGAPLLQEGEYSRPPRPWSGRGLRKREVKGHVSFLQTGNGVWLARGGLAQVAGCLGPSLALSFEPRCCDCLFTHH